MNINVWITDSIDFLIDISSFFVTPPIFYIVCCFLLVLIVKLFKGLVT